MEEADQVGAGWHAARALEGKAVLAGANHRGTVHGVIREPSVACSGTRAPGATRRWGRGNVDIRMRNPAGDDDNDDVSLRVL